jgi:SAM-dependent methyltransferase
MLPIKCNGSLDNIEDFKIRGWCQGPEEALVEVSVNEEVLGYAIPNKRRPDLLVAGLGDCAFELPIPDELLDGDRKKISARVVGGDPLPNSGRLETFGRRWTAPHGLARCAMRRGLWVIDGGAVADTRVALQGWAVSPFGSRLGEISTMAPLDCVWSDDPTLSEQFGLGNAGTVRRFRLSMDRPRDADHIRLSFGTNANAPFNKMHDWFLPLKEVETPPACNRARVHGNDDLFAFNLEGYTTARKLDALLRRYCFKGLNSVGRTLDWGVGCGRVARYILQHVQSLVGVDIDQENIEWCKSNLSGAFLTIDTIPPMNIPAATIDFAYGISVCTHLDEANQVRWLQELARVVKPGGILILTVLSAVAAVRSGLLNTVASLDRSKGFFDAGRNPDLDDFIEDKEYYRNVFHTHGYLCDVWQEYFDIIAIEEGVIGNHQDAVVMTRR